MNIQEVFDNNVVKYEAWYKDHPYVFQSELELIRESLPLGEILGIEVGLGTGRFSKELGIKEGVEPSLMMRKKAISRGIHVFDAVAERLPFKDMKFDFVLMINCIIYFEQMLPAFLEAKRVLKKGGCILIGFIDKDSTIGRYYVANKSTSTFYKQSHFYSVDQVKNEIVNAGFSALEIKQTLFGSLDDIKTFQSSREGYGKGSFVLIKAFK